MGGIMRETRTGIRRRGIQLVGIVVVLVAIGGGAFLSRAPSPDSEDDALVTKWLRLEALPFGSVFYEPEWTLELAATLDNPRSTKRVVGDVRDRFGGDIVATLKDRFLLVEDEDGARFDAPLMTPPNDRVGAHALARFAQAVHDATSGARNRGRSIASVRE
jgi:CelD/BcsL family acetyltransferase involved in cellulose biosynthesis